MVVQSQFIEMFGQISDTTPRYEVKKLSDCCSYISDGSHFSPAEDSSGPYPMLSVKDMTENGFVYYDCKYISKKDFDVLVSNGCQPHLNDVLVAKDGSYFKYSFVVTEDKDQAILSSIAILRPKTDVLDPRYLAYYMLTDAVIQLVEKNYLTGTAIRRVILKGFKEIPTIIPPMELQKSFVSVLGQADKSKFGGLKSQFIEETQRWENEGTIRDLIQNTVEKAGQKLSADSKLRYIDISSVDNGTNTVTGVTEYIFKDAPSRAQQCVRKGDILVSTVRPNLKNIAVNHLDGDDLVASSGFCVLRPKEGCAGLIMAYILSDVFTEKMTLVAKGTNYPAIHDSDILNYKIRLSDDSKVSMIDRLFKQADKSKFELKQAVEKIDKVMRALMQ